MEATMTARDLATALRRVEDAMRAWPFQRTAARDAA
jgi:hypothetical protein